jgi:hypothetical protein
MFSDTVTVTINAIDKTMSRINQDKYSSEYLLRGTTDEFRLRIRHSEYTDKARGGAVVDRHNVELVQTVYPVAPATKSTIRKAYIVLENERGDGLNDPLNFDLGFAGFLSVPNLTKLINWES